MIVFLIVLLVLMLILLCGVYYVYRVAFYSRKKGYDDVYAIPQSDQYDPHKEEMLELVHKMVEREFESVYITSFDGLRLFGRYYHVRDGAPIDIGFHGYRATALRDFCVGGNASFERGHNLLLIDERGQGKSQGSTITMGIKEHKDVLSWVNYLVKRFGDDTKIVLYGVSMGAASVVMSTSLDLPKNVKGVIADCPYSSPKDIILYVAQHSMKVPKIIALPFAILAARIFGGFNLFETTCKDAVKKSEIPILLIHGEDDRYVPCYMSEEIENANKERVTRYTFPDAGHGISYFSDKTRYSKLTEEFFEKCCE